MVRLLMLGTVAVGLLGAQAAPVVAPQVMADYVARFNAADEELYTNAIPNAAVADWMQANVPRFACPDADIERTYYFRWWTYRKHIRAITNGWVVTEFLPKVGWSGPHNTIVCPAGHHFMEGRWLRNPDYLNSYARFWFSEEGATKRYGYSTWLAYAIDALCRVQGDNKLSTELLDGFVQHFRRWETLPDLRNAWPQPGKVKMGGDGKGLFLSTDNCEGSEYSLSGHGYRPLFNSAMYAEAQTIATVARRLGRTALAEEFAAKAAVIEKGLKEKVWHAERGFFTAHAPEGKHSPVRELHGYAPWYFGLPLDSSYDTAWQWLDRNDGFNAPLGLTFPEQSAPGFKFTYEGHECQWNGPSWPFATSIALTALRNRLQTAAPNELLAPRRSFARLMHQYAAQQVRVREDGITVPWIDENYHPFTGDWISRTVILQTPKMKSRFPKERGKDYNHSSFCDLVIGGLCGLVPQADERIVVRPLAPAEWDWWCVEGICYHGHDLTILFDRTGTRYGRGKGLVVLQDGAPVAADVVQAAPVAASEAGGVTFDFKAITEKRFAATGSLVPVPLEQWKGAYCYMHNATIAGNDPRRKEVRKAVVYTIENGEASVLKKPELVTICGDEKTASSVSGGFVQKIILPDANGGEYRLSCRTRMQHQTQGGGYVLVTPVRAQGKIAKGDSAPGDRDAQLKVFPLNDVWSEWVPWAKVVRVPAGYDALNVVMRIDGVGELRFCDFSVTREAAEAPVVIKSTPADWLDGTFAVSRGQCALPCWTWKKTDSAAKYDPAKFTFTLTLPKGLSLVEAIFAETNFTSAVQADGSTVYMLKGTRTYGGMYLTPDFNGWNILSALVSAAPEAQPGVMTLVADYEGRRLTNVAQTRILVVPRVEAPRPRQYANGFYLGGAYAHLRSPAARVGFAEMFTAAGANWVVQMRPDDATRAIWRAKGVKYITPEFYHCANGFRVGDRKHMPVGEQYVPLPGGTHRELQNAVCPIAVYEEAPYFVTNTLPKFKEFLKGSDGLWANWEPYMFAGRGCMCAKCRAAFAKYVGVADEDMAKDWPQELAFGKKWFPRIQKFRSWQHGQVVKTIHRHVKAFTGGEASLGFIPGIAWCEMASCWRPDNLAAEVQAIDYAGDLDWIDPWGPYPWWDASAPYVANDCGYLSYFLAAKDVREQVNRDYGKKAPKLMSFPHGVQCTTAFAQPESIALAFDSFFFNGWEASVGYAFPKGYDARYWAAFAEATARAAKYERFVFEGTRCDTAVTVTLDTAKPFPPPAKAVYTKYLKYATNVPLVQHVAYRLEGKLIVAVFNFAEKDAAHVTIATPGGNRAVVVPASRCRVFEF